MKKVFLTFAIAAVSAAQTFAADLRIGIIGCDTSHCTEFTRRFNDATDKNHVPGGKVVAAFKGGSPDIDESWSRVEGYTQQLQEKYGVKIVGSIEELCSLVDVVMLESIDGRPHLQQAIPVFKAKKTVELSAMEFKLLQFLIANRGAVHSRNQLLDEVWGYDAMPSTRTVDVHVAWLRQKLEDNPKYPQFIQTVHGFGYKFNF